HKSRMHFSCQHRKRSECLISTVISTKSHRTTEPQQHSKQCNHDKRRVALAVPPFIPPRSAAKAALYSQRFTKGARIPFKTPRPTAQSSKLKTSPISICNSCFSADG